MNFPPHVSFGWIDVDGDVDAEKVAIECRAYETTCWITAGGESSKEAYRKISRYVESLGVEPPVPSLTRLAATNDEGVGLIDRRADHPVRVFAFLLPSNPLTGLATFPCAALAMDVGVFFEPRCIAFAMPFEGRRKLVGDDEVARWSIVFRRAFDRLNVASAEWKNIHFATYDTSTAKEFSRRNEIVLYM